MKLPERVKIGLYDYEIKVVENLRGEKNEDLYGHWHPDPPNIEIKSGLVESRTVAVLIHEVLHALDEYLAAGLTEKQITRLAPALTAFLRDNRLNFEPSEEPSTAEAQTGP